ncbi:phosphatase PAP2 family protein [Candidatus Cloacimonadota bacterium]
MKYRILSTFILPMLILVLISVLINITGLDITFQKIFYSGNTGWFLKDAQPWKFIYHYGNLPALFISLLALIILALNSYKSKLNKYAKRSLYLLLVMAVGPGLMINSVLKDNWGRPRPRNITDFGGKHKFEQVLTIDPESTGKSFPCGHASMGFYFFVFYYLFRKRKNKLAATSLFFAIIWGGLIGFARIVQGGHFLSDVIWSGGVVFLVSALFYFLLKMETEPEFTRQLNIKTRNRRLLAVFSSFFIIVAVVIFSLATPYSKTKIYTLSQKIPQNKYVYTESEFDLLPSDISLKIGEEFKIDFKAGGFGFPGSKIKNKLRFSDLLENNNQISYKQTKSGFFTELEQENLIEIPANLVGDISIRSDQGNLKLYIPENSNWIIIPYDVETVLDSTDYLSKRREISHKHEHILQIGINLSLGSLEIITE